MERREMSYSSDPVLDEMRHSDAQDASTERLVIEKELAKQEIANQFLLIDKLPLAQITLPAIGHSTREVRIPMSEALLELIHEGEVDALLLKVLQDSPCALVAQLRAGLCAKWQDKQVDWLAEARA
jgi:hypothetical protein